MQRILSFLSRGGAALVLVGFAALTWTAAAEDWPTYRHDNRRSATTSEKVDVAALKEAWVYQSPAPPQTAWSGPAKWDSYAGLVGMHSMRNYDPAFYVIAVGDAAYFGSSVEDCVTCLDAASGEERWSSFADGPVRITPSFSDGRIYFGADDGYAYCVKAKSGAEVWKYRPSTEERLVPNNGKLIPMWPIRTGVLVDAGKAYFGAAFMPWRESYLCAVDAKSGKAEGTGLYRQTMTNVTMEGALLASPTKLYVPQGRSAPMVFNRPDGKFVGAVEGGGGVFAVLTPDMRFAHGPGNKAGWITVSNAETRDKVASFDGGNAMIVTGDRSFILKDRALLAIDRAAGKTLWETPSVYPYTLVLAGDVLVVGGNGKVAAFSTTDDKELGTLPVSGRAYGLAVANGRLYVSTDTGAIHCFK
jgi:outer membrane protein assembly factor BamB